MRFWQCDLCVYRISEQFPGGYVEATQEHARAHGWRSSSNIAPSGRLVTPEAPAELSAANVPKRFRVAAAALPDPAGLQLQTAARKFAATHGLVEDSLSMVRAISRSHETPGQTEIDETAQVEVLEMPDETAQVEVPTQVNFDRERQRARRKLRINGTK